MERQPVKFEHPIIFSGPMVKALLAGTKTQTRRVVALEPWARGIAAFRAEPGARGLFDAIEDDGACNGSIVCPYGVPGSVLYVRENWKGEYVGIDDVQVTYFADGARRHYPRRLRPQGWLLPKHATLGRVVPSIHMPRFISRLKLTLLSVRVERLQTISEPDAIAEGFEASGGVLGDGPLRFVPQRAYSDTNPERGSAVEAFSNLWDSINGGDPWDSDPWVWALTFTVEQFPLQPGVVEHGR